ncbi:hypothetical protein GCM10010452_83920 [Crossiella cryophila]|uniref:Uncharacterized protein n=1 Tax=Crossiella cryophila TaxID=43355 RepID=A0A7W7CIG3_9PSEU|nr:hypothetical protein [Crossiella cryophila]
MADPRRCFTCNNKGEVMANCNISPYWKPCPAPQCPSKGTGKPTPRPISPRRRLAMVPSPAQDPARLVGQSDVQEAG